MNISDFMSDLDSVDTAIGIDTQSLLNKGGGQDYNDVVNSLSYAYVDVGKKVPRDLPANKLRLNPVTTFSIKYHLDADQLEWLEKEVPSRRFRYEPEKAHDHPRTNILNPINESVIIEKFRGAPFVDLHGNAARNAHLKGNARVYRGKFTTRDYLRETVDGDKTLDYISTDWVLTQNVGVKFFLANHSAYYLSIEDIASIVYSTKGAELHAIVHRHDRLRGKINGEFDYIVDEYGYVHQISPLGETYSHPSMEPYFHQYEANTSKGVIAWTANKMAGDTYHLKFVACPGYDSTKVKPFALPKYGEKADPVIKVTAPDYKIKSVFGYEWITYNDHADVVLDNIALYDKLCKFIAGKDRTETTLKDLSLFCRRLIDKNDLFAKHSGEYFEIPHEHMIWYILAAFYQGIENENRAMLHYRRKHRKEVKLHQSLKEDITAKDSTISDTFKDVTDAAVTASTQTLKFMGAIGDSCGATLAKDIVLNGASRVVLEMMQSDEMPGTYHYKDKDKGPKVLVKGLA